MMMTNFGSFLLGSGICFLISPTIIRAKHASNYMDTGSITGFLCFLLLFAPLFSCFLSIAPEINLLFNNIIGFIDPKTCETTGIIAVAQAAPVKGRTDAEAIEEDDLQVELAG